jgi:hypothetical protein
MGMGHGDGEKGVDRVYVPRRPSCGGECRIIGMATHLGGSRRRRARRKRRALFDPTRVGG